MLNIVERKYRLSDVRTAHCGRAFLFDVSNIAHRSWHANSEMESSGTYKAPESAHARLTAEELRIYYGERSGHVYGFVKTLLSFLAHNPRRVKTGLVYAFDGKAEHKFKILPGYKGNRDRKADPVPDVRRLCHSLPGHCIANIEEEADDLIASMVRYIREKERENRRSPMEIIIVSGDHDMYQLIDENTYVWNSVAKPKVDLSSGLDPKKYQGIGPHQIVLWKSLFGDSSDNIPGLKGLLKAHVLPAILKSDGTPKSFLKILKKQHKAGSVNPKTAKRVIAEFEAVVLRNWSIVNLNRNARFKVCTRDTADHEKLTSTLIHRYGCESLRTRIKLLP